MESIKLLIKKWKDGSLHETVEELRWIWSYGKRYWKEILFYCFLSVFGTVFSLVSSVASKNIIDIVTGIQKDKLVIMISIMIPMALFSLLFSSLCGRISLKINIRIQNDIQADIFDKIVNVRWLDLSGYTPGDLLNRFGNDVGVIAGSAIGWLPSLVSSLFSFICTLALVIYYDPTMGLITLVNAPIMLITSQFTLRRMREYTEKVKEMNSDVLQFQQETFNNMDTIKSFGLTGSFSKQLRYWQRQFKDVTLEHNRFSIILNIIMSLLGMVIQYAAYFWCIYRLWSGHITYGEMTLFLSQGYKLSGTFKSVVSIIPKTVSATICARRVMDIVELPREEKLTEASAVLHENAKDGFSVEFRGLSFGYSPERTVFENASFTAKPGEIVGLVGPSGAGKTTCIRLLLGMVTPDRGAAVLEDSQGNNVPMNADTRALFSYVPQGNTVFSGTVSENLRMVAPEANEEALKHALETACALDFVEKLPQGLESRIGQKGRGLSEGQAQRIAIARAVLRDAPILLLDEATSALDPETERRILNNLLTSNPQKTCIVTTHRPSTLSECHRVYRICNGTLQLMTKEEIQNYGR